MSTSRRPPVPPGKMLIFRRFRTDRRSGRLLDARRYGLKGWPMLVDVTKKK